MERKYAWHNYDDATMKKVYALSDTYRQFLDNGKTERECVVQAVEFAEAKGYVNLNDIIKSNTSIKAGDKIYYTHMDKSIALFNIGTDDIELGMNILGAHIDSPRIDVKQNPQYEDSNLLFWDTHYYGGIKKYHWVAMPLAIHGVVVKTDGTRININYFIEEVIDEDRIEDIYEYFKESTTDDINEALTELGSDYSEDEVRLVRIKFLSELAN